MSFYARFSASGALASLEKLFLSANGIGDEGMSALAKAITPDKDGKGALAQCTYLSVSGNTIGDAGMSALASACASGALAPGATVYLGANSATETGKQAMRDAAKARGLSVFV